MPPLSCRIWRPRTAGIPSSSSCAAPGVSGRSARWWRSPSPGVRPIARTSRSGRSPLRCATTISTRRGGRRSSRASSDSEPLSAHWTSSSTITSGSAASRSSAAVSAPWRAAPPTASAPAGARPASVGKTAASSATRAGPSAARSSSRSSLSGPSSASAKIPCGTPPSSSSPTPATERRPRAQARARSSRSSALLPIPGSPLTISRGRSPAGEGGQHTIDHLELAIASDELVVAQAGARGRSRR